MLVIRTRHFWLSSAPARRSGHGIMRVQLLMAQSAERELGMAWLWPKRLDIEVPAAVCTAATMGALGQIPVETRIAPKSENWQLSPHRRGVGELCAWSWRVFWRYCGRPWRPLTKRLRLMHGDGPRASIGLHSHGHAATGRNSAKTLDARRPQKLKISHWGPSHVEMTSPTVRSVLSLSLTQQKQNPRSAHGARTLSTLQTTTRPELRPEPHAHLKTRKASLHPTP